MKLSVSILLLVATILILGGSGLIIYYIDNQINFTDGLTDQVCTQAGGSWNACGNKCEISNAGNPNVACTQLCEEICECGTLSGLICPEGFECITPRGIADARGYCKKE